MCPTESPGYEAKTTGRKELGTCVLPTDQWKIHSTGTNSCTVHLADILSTLLSILGTGIIPVAIV